MTIEEEQAAEIERLEKERNALREENARLRAENKHTITQKIVLEWYPELDKQIGCYDYRVAMNYMGQAFDVFRQLVLYPALDENVLLREDNSRLRELLDDVYAQWDGDWPEELVARMKAAIRKVNRG